MMELSLLNAYLAVLVVFELVEIKIKLWDGGKLNSFGRSLTNGSAERRLWSFMLALLAISRTVALCYPDDVGVWVNLALVHIVECLYMSSEKLIYKSGGPVPILVIIIANAVFFSILAPQPLVFATAAACAVIFALAGAR